MKRTIFLVFLLFTHSTFAADSKPLTSYSEVLEHWSGRGFWGTVHISQNGETLFEGAAGYADREANRLSQINDQYVIGSVSKQFTAVLLLRLRDRGLLDLDAPVARYLANFPNADRITVRQILNHTAGLFNYTNALNLGDLVPEPFPDLWSVISTFRDRPLQFEPGTQWEYSNSGYLLAAAVYEKLTGQSYADALQSEIFGPLKIEDCGFSPQYNFPRATRGYYRNRDYTSELITRPIDLGWAHAAGGITCSARSLSRWNQALDQNELITSDSRKEMETPGQEEYGLGVIIHDLKNGKRLIAHSGGLPGFTSMNFRLPEQGISIVVLSNNMMFSSPLANGLLKITLDGKAWGESALEPIPIDPKTLSDFTGEYHIENEAVLGRVFTENGRLYWEQVGAPPRFAQSWMIPTAQDVFELPFAGARFQANRDALGTVLSFTVFQGGQEIRLLRKGN